MKDQPLAVRKAREVLAKGDKDDADASRSLSDKNINVVDTSTVGFGTKLGTGLSDKFKTKVDYLKEAKKIKNK